MTAPNLVSYQVGFLRGRGYTDAQIDQFATTMHTEPTVQPRPRSQRPRHVLHPTKSLRGPEPHTTAGPRHQPEDSR